MFISQFYTNRPQLRALRRTGRNTRAPGVRWLRPAPAGDSLNVHRGARITVRAVCGTQAPRPTRGCRGSRRPQRVAAAGGEFDDALGRVQIWSISRPARTASAVCAVRGRCALAPGSPGPRPRRPDGLTAGEHLEGGLGDVAASGGEGHDAAPGLLERLRVGVVGGRLQPGHVALLEPARVLPEGEGRELRAGQNRRTTALSPARLRSMAERSARPWPATELEEVAPARRSRARGRRRSRSGRSPRRPAGRTGPPRLAGRRTATRPPGRGGRSSSGRGPASRRASPSG